MSLTSSLKATNGTRNVILVIDEKKAMLLYAFDEGTGYKIDVEGWDDLTVHLDDYKYAGQKVKVRNGHVFIVSE